MVVLMTEHALAKVAVDAVFPGSKIVPMSEYSPSPFCKDCPKDFRVLDCWQCFEAQGKVCMDKNHRSLYYHMETSKAGAVFCCDPNYNEGYCKDGS